MNREIKYMGALILPDEFEITMTGLAELVLEGQGEHGLDMILMNHAQFERYKDILIKRDDEEESEFIMGKQYYFRGLLIFKYSAS